MTTIDSVGNGTGAQPRQEPVSLVPARSAAPPAAPTQLQSAVQQAARSETTRHTPERASERPAMPLLSASTQTAAYLTEMRLSQELESIREKLKD